MIIFMVAHHHDDRHVLRHDLAQPRKPVHRPLANIAGDDHHIDPGQRLDRLDVGHVGVEIGEDVEVHVGQGGGAQGSLRRAR